MDIMLEKAIDLSLMERGFYSGSAYTPVYLFSTENISGLLKKVDIKGKKVLTISSSGDHIFNMLLNGATDIDGFDINYFTMYYYYFKEAAIKVFSYDEFLEFFFSRRFRNKVFDDKNFFRVLSAINDVKALKFWKELYLKFGGKALYYSNLFIGNIKDKNTYIACNDYLRNEDNYKKLQGMLKDYNYKFIRFNLFEDISCIDDEYDFIYLSNVFGWLHCNSEEEYVLKVKEVVNNMEKYLTSDGVIGVCYLYFFLDQYWNLSNNRDLNSSDIRKKYFDDYTYFLFNGFNCNRSRKLEDRDGVMLKKVKKIG